MVFYLTMIYAIIHHVGSDDRQCLTELRWAKARERHAQQTMWADFYEFDLIYLRGA